MSIGIFVIDIISKEMNVGGNVFGPNKILFELSVYMHPILYLKAAGLIFQTLNCLSRCVRNSSNIDLSGRI